VALDEVELEEERLDLVPDLDPFDALGDGDHLTGALGHRRRRAEVVRQTTAQPLGLAHVDDPALGVLEEVGAGAGRDGAGLRSVDHSPIIQGPRKWQESSEK
jgi:hypothetical protein